MINLNKIHLMPAREQVASILRKAILSREFKEGTAITLEEISKQLGVSITPVREAFQILSGDGLIKLRPNKGAIVLGINEKTIRDHYETRAILESAAVYKVCKSGTDITNIVAAFLHAKEALNENDYMEYTKHNQSFHLEIWTAADNDKIKSLLSSMWNGLSMGSNVKEKEYAQISIKEHEKIVEAIQRREAEAARDLMNQHIMRSLENILTHYNE